MMTGGTMEKEIAKTDEAPAAIGPYSQGVKVAGLVFVSGQIPLVPETGQVIEGDIADQTERVMKNLEAVLVAAGSSLDRVVKTTIYLKNLDDFEKVNEVYGRYFRNAPPARATVEVSKLPKGVSIEIDAVAAAG